MSVNRSATPAGGANTGTTSDAGTSSRNWRANGGRSNRRTPRTINATNAFKGTVTEMNGHVFQCYGEATKIPICEDPGRARQLRGPTFQVPPSRHQANDQEHGGHHCGGP
jgi:hypothetical protein